MKKRVIGKTGKEASILGLGTMRLPVREAAGKQTIKEEESLETILKSFELGINILDTAYTYCHKQSEKVSGKALKIWRGKNSNSIIYLSTKFPTWLAKKRSDYRLYLEEQLKTLDVNHIDFYHFHSLNDEYFTEKVLKLNLIPEAIRAKDEGLIKHISFSFHDTPDIMKKIIDTEVFEAVLCQYNILDPVNEEAIAYAGSKGLGVFVMGPLGGGRIKALEYFKDIFGKDIRRIHEIALKFVFANPDISVAFSGMENISMVQENAKIADSFSGLSSEEKEILDRFMSHKKLEELIPCTNCKYCLPCPNAVAIPIILRISNYNTLTGLIDNTSWQYENILLDGTSKTADACTECGQCEEKCPQGIEIIRNLKNIHKILSSKN